MEGVIHWLGTRPKLVRDEDLSNAKKEAEEALRYYEKLWDLGLPSSPRLVGAPAFRRRSQAPDYGRDENP